MIFYIFYIPPETCVRGSAAVVSLDCAQRSPARYWYFYQGKYTTSCETIQEVKCKKYVKFL